MPCTTIISILHSNSVVHSHYPAYHKYPTFTSVLYSTFTLDFPVSCTARKNVSRCRRISQSHRLWLSVDVVECVEIFVLRPIGRLVHKYSRFAQVDQYMMTWEPVQEGMRTSIWWHEDQYMMTWGPVHEDMKVSARVPVQEDMRTSAWGLIWPVHENQYKRTWGPVYED